MYVMSKTFVEQTRTTPYHIGSGEKVSLVCIYHIRSEEEVSLVCIYNIGSGEEVSSRMNLPNET